MDIATNTPEVTWDWGADLEETLFRRQPWADAQKSLLLFLLFLLKEIV